MVNDKSQDSTAKHFSCDWLLHYKFIIEFASEKHFKVGEHMAKLQAMVDHVIRPIRLRLSSSNMKNSPDK